MIAKNDGFETTQLREIYDSFSGAEIPCAESAACVRPYCEKDRDAIRRICCDTGFLGNPADALFQDRELFADLFTRPYLQYEPEWALVAETDGKVVGYLLGSVRRNFDFLLLRSGFQTSSKMLLNLAAGRYSGHARSKRFVRWLFTNGLWEQPKHPANAAHLHFDVDKAYRGRAIGRHLWSVYEKKLLAAGIQQCYGSFFSHRRRRPELAYARFGFKVFDRKRTTLFQPEIPDPVEVVCVHKELDGMNGHSQLA